jgi:hypothetical protein
VQGLLEPAHGHLGLRSEDPVDLEALAGFARTECKLLDPAYRVALAATLDGDNQR